MQCIIDKATKAAATRQRSLSQQPRDAPPTPSKEPHVITIPTTNGNDSQVPSPTTSPTTPRQIPTRPGFTRSNSEKSGTSPGASPGRRGSWFSNISSKFSSGNAANQSPPQTNNTPAKQGEISAPKANPAKNAVLQHAAKYDGEGPYTPAPPRNGQAGILHVFRRLSSSNGSLAPALKSNAHGLVERKVLNVDRHRERCPISDLKQAKLRRVAFSVDVEIAPMPKYAEGGKTSNGVCAIGDKTQKRKITEKGEGAALRNPKAIEEQKEHDGEIKATGEELPKEPACEGSDIGPAAVPIDTKETTPESQPDKAAAETKKKEKKKKSEEERKARKEKKRKLAEANGTIPMEIHYDSDSSTGSNNTADRPRSPQVVPTTNPVRIYRRCCQLRETPILKKLTEQLSDPANCSGEPGLVEKLDLTGYWMQLADLVTLGDYLAVVPVKEVIIENCGITDEGLRVILAGLLAARKPENKRKSRHLTAPDGLCPQGGVVERLVLKNNKLGPEGWKHLCLFIYLCRSLKFLDISSIPFPTSAKNENGNAHLQQNGNQTRLEICRLFATSVGDRLGGSTLSLLNIGETGISMQQLGAIVDGIIKCGVKRVGLAHNDIDAEGVKHIARYVSSGKCDGLDLGGNDLRDQLEVLVDSMNESCPLWALSLAECNLKPASLCKLLPKLIKLPCFRFIDLSHNHELFSSNPSAIPVLRR